MEKQKKRGVIAFVILLCIVGLSFIYSYRFILVGLLFSEDFNLLNHLFLLLLYSAICVPVVILRVKFEFKAVKWIILATTVLAIICCVNIILLQIEIRGTN